jgi:cysteinyl-tRNA synthetase
LKGAKLRLYDSLTRSTVDLVPVEPGLAKVYSCGPTVYHDAHIGNLRAYVFTDVLTRTLRSKGLEVRHVMNITDVGHLVADSDDGDDKMENAASRDGLDAWSVAARYTARFLHDLERLGIVRPTEMPRATEYVDQMIAFGEDVADHCYELDGGLYFDTSTVPAYGAISGKASETVEGRIETIAGKRQPADFAVWRRSPEGVARQMEWDSPWGRGAPGWHLECSVMSRALLGERFDVHTGGVDHREVHHPNEIAQNQARSCSSHSGASVWMHNNFLVDRNGKMSKSNDGFLTLQTLVDAGHHPLSYRLMCLQAHYRSELAFDFDDLGAARIRLKRLVRAVGNLRLKDDGTLKGDPTEHLAALDEAMSDDLSTPRALVALDAMLADKRMSPTSRLKALAEFDDALGLALATTTASDLRTRPVETVIPQSEVEALMEDRLRARTERDFATSDALRDRLIEAGVEVMDGDPMGWDWRPQH